MKVGGPNRGTKSKSGPLLPVGQDELKTDAVLYIERWYKWYNIGMALKLYRRHMRTCIVNEQKFPPKKARVYMACECPIWITGTSSGVRIPRKSTGTSDLAVAQAIRLREIEKSSIQNLPDRTLTESVFRSFEAKFDAKIEKLQQDIDRICAELKGISA